MGETLRGDVATGRSGRRAGAFFLTLLCLLLLVPTLAAQEEATVRLRGGRFTVVTFPQDSLLGTTLLGAALARDTFPGLPRPRARVLVAIAPDARRFREWIGPYAPEWGAAIAFPDEQRVVMQGRRAGSGAGNPSQVLRHELAHLALNEYLGPIAPRWFDEGYASYAAAEWGRDEVLAASVALVLRGVPRLDSLDRGFYGGERVATDAYALSHRAVAELASLDEARGLALFLRYWRETGSMDRAMRMAYGMPFEAFDEHFRRRTLRRYGALAVLANVSLGLGLAGTFAIPLYIVRRRRMKRRLEALRVAEAAAERAERDRAIEELLRGADPPRME